MEVPFVTAAGTGAAAVGGLADGYTLSVIVSHAVDKRCAGLWSEDCVFVMCS